MMNKNKLPIIAYFGVDNNPNIEENFKRFKRCGFDVSFYRYPWLWCPANGTTAQEALEIASKNGIELIIQSSTIFDDPEGAANELKDKEGFYAYYIQDEPTTDRFDYYAGLIERIRKIDDKHKFYVNLLPCYDKYQTFGPGVTDYRTYLEESTKMKTQQISFDYYPITTNGIRSSWYDNLTSIKALSDEHNIPWWGFVLSNEHGPYPLPTYEMMSLQAFTNLAYGAQGIEYFSYQTPENDGTFDFYNGPIEKDGTVTNTWYLVQKLNELINKVSPIFYGAKNFDIHHSEKCLWWRGIKKKKLPSFINSLSITNKKDCFTSSFENNGNRYFMVMNKDYKTSVEIKLSADSNVKYIDKETMTEFDTKKDYTIQPGDFIIFKN